MALLITPLERSLKFRPGRAPAYGSRAASSPDAVQGRLQPMNSGRPLAPSPPASSRARDWLHDIREQLRKTTRLQPRQGLAQRAVRRRRPEILQKSPSRRRRGLQTAGQVDDRRADTFDRRQRDPARG